MAVKKLHRYAVLAGLLILSGGLLAFYYPASESTPPDLAELEASEEKGRYLAKAGNCATCHTAEGGEPYAGGLAFETPFGTLYSTNITMDEETGIGSWSFEDFYRSMKHGVRPDGKHLYPAFPYTDFARMTDEDIASLYLYMQTVAPVHSPAKANELQFPYSSRQLLYFWKRIFHDADTFTPDPEQSDEWNRGAYLVEGPGHCGACHTPRNALGATREDRPLSGGVYLDKVKTGEYRKWSAVNLTPAASGLAAWTTEDIAAYLKEGQNRHTVVHGPMTEVVLNSTRYLRDDDALAIATYLKNIPVHEDETGSAPGEEVMAAGEVVYTVHCGSCHLPTGLGDAGLGAQLAGSPIVQSDDPSSLINTILYGPDLPPPPFVSERTNMKMFGKRLSDEDIAHVASYIRASFGNQAGVVTPEQVEAQR